LNFIGFGEESGHEDYFEPKRGFSMGHPLCDSYETQDEFEALFSQSNVFPPSFGEDQKAGLNSISQLLSSLSSSLLNQIGSSLLGEDALGWMEKDWGCLGEEKLCLLRLFHYHDERNEATSRNEEEMKDLSNNKISMGSANHTDWGLLTLVVANGPGLQVYVDEEWVDVPWEEGSLIVNVGDYLSLLSNNQLVSPVHRVLPPPPSSSRTSFVHFQYPSFSSSFPPHTTSPSSSLPFNTFLSDWKEEDSFGSLLKRKWEGVDVTS